jgi:hypothetical protein
MYYRIVDSEGEQYNSGLNCTSKEDVKEQWLSLQEDQMEEEYPESYTLEDMLAAQFCYLEESETRFPEPDHSF